MLAFDAGENDVSQAPLLKKAERQRLRTLAFVR